MLISKNWLSQFVELPKKLTAKELAEKMTLASVEVEGYRDLAQDFNGVIVAQILEVKKHPNADKLQIATVDSGKEKLEIVCGAPNIAAGQKVPLATIGTYLPAMKMTIEQRAVRGVTSQGMLCAPDELGLGNDHAGILILDEKAKIGRPLAEELELDDWILEVDNKSMTHRPDMWGHQGIAREVSAFLKTKFKAYAPAEIISEGSEKLKVEIKDKKACPRYMVLVMDGVKVGPSPDWLKNQLAAIGQKSINNIVDVTNFVMNELGQPMHAFDAAKISGQHIVVRKAADGEKLLALDEKEYELSGDDLVIADAEKPLAIAGIMGGKESGISASTTKIILEAANFDHIGIRKSSQKLGLRSDSSARFEKSLDPNLTEAALSRGVELIKKICPEAKVVSKVADESHFKLNQGPIKTSVEYIQKRIGQDIPAKEIISILESLGFEIKSGKDGQLSAVIPTWRATKDVSQDYDLVEEVARIYGFNNITAELPSIKVVRPNFDPLKEVTDRLKPILAYGFEMAEVYNYPFVADEQLKKMGLNPEDHIKVLNPQAKGLESLQTTLLTNLLKNLEQNARFYPSCSLFEVASVFNKKSDGEEISAGSDEKLPLQDLFCAGAIFEKGNKQPFYIAKNIVEIALHRLHFVPEFFVETSPAGYLNPERHLAVKVGGRVIGHVSEIEPKLGMKLGHKNKVAVFEINLSELAKDYSDDVEFQPIPKYPSIEMDISMIVDRQLHWEKILKTIKELGVSLIRNIEIFDIYYGENIPPDKKSVAFRITYRSDDKTLETAEAEAVHKQVKDQLKAKVDAAIRE